MTPHSITEYQRGYDVGIVDGRKQLKVEAAKLVTARGISVNKHNLLAGMCIEAAAQEIYGLPDNPLEKRKV